MNTKKEPQGNLPSFLNTWGGVCLFLFVVSVEFSTTISQALGFMGVGILIAQWRMGHFHPRSLIFPILPNFLIFSVAALWAIIMAIDPIISLSYSKKLLEPLVFYWVINQGRRMRLFETSLINHFFPEKSTFRNFSEMILKPLKEIPPAVMLLSAFVLISLIHLIFVVLELQNAPEHFAGRPTGFFHNPIPLSILLMMVALLVLTWAVSEKKGRSFKAVLVLLFVFGLLISQSREAWVGFIVGSICIFFIKNRKWLIGVPLAIAFIYFASPNQLQQRMESTFSLQNNQDRLELWTAGLEIIKEHPFTGVGFYGFPLVRFESETYLKKISIKFEHFHIPSVPIQITVDSGILGLVAWCSIWVGYFCSLKNLWRDRTTPGSSNWLILGSGVSVVSFLTASLFEDHFYNQKLISILYIIMALPFI